MIKTVAVDTNALLDFRLKREPGFKKTKQVIKSCSSEKTRMFIPSIVFPEIEWVLRSFYKQSKELIINFLEELLELEGLILENKLEMKNALIYFKYSNIKFTDSIILSQIQRVKPDEFLTFDEDLQKIYQEQF